MENPTALAPLEGDILDSTLMPESLQADRYFVMNDHFVKQVEMVNRQIILLQNDFKPWEVKAVRLMETMGHVAISKEVKKRVSMITALFKRYNTKQLCALYQARSLYQDGPNEMLRRNKLWMIAVDNQDVKPQTAIEAIKELNKMAAPKTAGVGQPIQIIINNDILPRGALD